MKTTKIYSGLYKVEYNGHIFEIENMKEYDQDWVIREDGEWIGSYYTKGICQDWIKECF